jgi:2-polyprenyl-3-methyl-5-hydroxy-6-metoxy-1,4-benzoquinol methylase
MNAIVQPYANVAGNAYDKYGTRNPLARMMMAGFLHGFDDLVGAAAPRTVFEAGCGEGELSLRLLKRGIDVWGCDLEDSVVQQANMASNAAGFGMRFVPRSIYDIDAGQIKADLLVCCEVLEHLPDVKSALDMLLEQRAGHWLFSVPREPIWRGLNMARGKYLRSLGNTPGHIQHWSAAGFRRLIESRFTVVAQRRPLPWTMLLCTRKPG